MPPLFLALFLLAASVSPPPEASTPAAKQSLRAGIGALLQADGAGARDRLSQIPEADLSAKDASLRTCILSRLTVPESDGAGASGAFADQVLVAYQAYWRRSAIDPSGRLEAERDLAARLSAVLGLSGPADMTTLEPLLADRLEKDGLHSLQGKTGKLHELMIWSRQTVSVETVSLPEGANATRVIYLDGFLTRGWSNYLACDRTGSAGWTKPDGLYVVVPAYESLADENFRVNFLAHESQHYSDNKRFPNLPSWRLEYRAKLVELVYASETRAKVLQRFTDSQGDDPADGHSYANKKVVLTLKTALGVDDLSATPMAALRKAAQDELFADTRRLRAERPGQ